MPDEDTKVILKEQIERRRLSRLLASLPVFSGYISPDGHLSRAQPETDTSFLWSLPAFSYAHDSISQVVDLCEAAARGERVQVERPYWTDNPDRPKGFSVGLLTLTPIFDDNSHVEEIAVSLIDCEDAVVAPVNEFTKSRLSEANHRIGIMLSLAQTVIEASSGQGDLNRDALTRRLDVLGTMIDLISNPETSQTSLKALIQTAAGQLPETLKANPLKMDVGHVAVPIEKAPLITLLLSELFDNAWRHGAWRNRPTDPLGIISIHAEILDSAYGKNLHLHWIEDQGPSVAGLLERGFGFTLAKRLFPQLTDGDAHMQNSEEGLSWSFKLPLPDDEAHPSQKDPE